MTHAPTWTEARLPSRRNWTSTAQAALGFAAVALVWWLTTRVQFADAGVDDMLGTGKELSAVAVVLLTLASLAGRFVGFALEAGFYHAWWRLWGAPVRFGRFYAWVAGLSLIDAWALGLRTIAREEGGTLALGLAPLVGMDLLRDGPVGSATSLQLAFGGLGVATLVRISLMALAQARETGRELWKPLLLTVVMWIAGRVATWWTLDLARGASPLP